MFGSLHVTSDVSWLLSILLQKLLGRYIFPTVCIQEKIGNRLAVNGILPASGRHSQESTPSSGGFVVKCDWQRRNGHVRNLSMENSSDALRIGKVLEKFEKYCVPVRNETYERYVFFKREQLSNELLDSYVTALMKLLESCVFGALRESLIGDRLILGVKDDRVCEKPLGK